MLGARELAQVEVGKAWRYQGPKRPHKHKDLTFWFQGPIQGGIPEIMVCRILMFMWLFGGPRYQGLDEVLLALAITTRTMKTLEGGCSKLGIPSWDSWFDTTCLMEDYGLRTSTSREIQIRAPRPRRAHQGARQRHLEMSSQALFRHLEPGRQLVGVVLLRFVASCGSNTKPSTCCSHLLCTTRL